jgi:hypothetical protein
MRLHEEFGLSVSDDTIYRALKNLGFSHVSARPKAYKQNAEAMDAFKKTSPSVWRKSVRNSHPTYRWRSGSRCYGDGLSGYFGSPNQRWSCHDPID